MSSVQDHEALSIVFEKFFKVFNLLKYSGGL